MSKLAAALALALVMLVATDALAAPQAAFRLEGKPHVDVPFELTMLVEGFEETPAPTMPPLQLANATVTPIGATPEVARSIQIINGRRSESLSVTWKLRWRVEVHKEGTLRVPQTLVMQGPLIATAQAGDIGVDTIPTTDAMKLTLALPDRPVFVGETVPVELVWLFRQQPDEQTFAVPLMTNDAFTVQTAPVTDKSRALPFTAGAKEIPVPYVGDTVDGFHRIRFTFFVAPRKTGKVEIPASSVIASLPVGRRDFFGNAATRPFRALDAVRSLEVKPLPETDRPANFAGAVGEKYSIAVHTSRSVVQLGEPVELDITIKSSQRLDTLSLGKLDGPGGLPKDKFTVPAEAPTGELSEDGLTKTFKVIAQVTGPATEIPAIAFAYFDPKTSTYQTIASDPIAVSVKGGSIVGAESVISSAPRKGATPAGTDLDLALVNAQLALSSSGDADDRPLSGSLLWILIGLLYAVPLGVFAARSWQIHTRDKREDAAEVRAARRRLDTELERAAKLPAREAAGPVVAAVRELARATGQPLAEGNSLLARLETEAFAPSAAELPLPSEIRTEVTALTAKWIAAHRTAKPGQPVARTAALVLLVAAALAPRAAHADTLEDGRTAYQQAMQMPEASARKARFARAAAAFGEAARATPDRPELLADWGNAALGAGDVASATLAYRRTLAIDGGNGRARHNLAWLRSRQTDVFRPSDGGAAGSLFFFHHWPRAQRLVVGAAAFALCILLVVPWSGRRRRGLVALAVIPLAVWGAMLVSLVVEDRRADDAVVMDDVVLRAADSAGAPAAMAQSVPRGAEVTILERRDAWTRVQIANGTSGWLQAGTIESVFW